MPQPLGVIGGVDDAAAYKVPCACATTGDMTNTMIGLPVIDGYQTKLGDRVLVWQNTDPTTNGIYWIPSGPQPPGLPPPVSTGAWVRAIDFTNTDAVDNGTQVLVVNGTLYAGQIFVCTTNRPTFGATPINFSLSALAAQAAVNASAAAASAAAAAASAAAASAAAAGSGGTTTIPVTGGTLTLNNAQANSASITFTGTLVANQFINFPAIANPKLVIFNKCVMNGFTLYLRGNNGADGIGVWYPVTWATPRMITVTPSRVWQTGYEAAPPGSFMDLALGSVIPPGWLVCDGSSYSTTLYDLLFGAIGYYFGGAGAAFNIPDMRGRVAVTADNLGTAAGNANVLPGNPPVGAVIGEATHTLTLTEIPNHTHSYNQWQTGAGTGVNGTATYLQGNVNANTGAAGGGAAHNNVQPGYTTMKLIRF